MSAIKNKKNKSALSVNYKIDSKLKITSYSGFGLFKKAMEEFSVSEQLAVNFGMKKRTMKYSEQDYFYFLIANLASGGKAVNNIMRFEDDKVFTRAFNFSKGLPQSSAIYKFLSKADENSVQNMYFL